MRLLPACIKLHERAWRRLALHDHFLVRVGCTDADPGGFRTGIKHRGRVLLYEHIDVALAALFGEV